MTKEQREASFETASKNQATALIMILALDNALAACEKERDDLFMQLVDKEAMLQLTANERIAELERQVRIVDERCKTTATDADAVDEHLRLAVEALKKLRHEIEANTGCSRADSDDGSDDCMNQDECFHHYTRGVIDEALAAIAKEKNAKDQ